MLGGGVLVIKEVALWIISDGGGKAVLETEVDVLILVVEVC